MKREDWKEQKALFKMDQAAYKDYMRYPFVYMSPEDFEKRPLDMNDELPENFTVSELMTLLPFNKFIWKQGSHEPGIEVSIYVNVLSNQPAPKRRWSAVKIEGALIQLEGNDQYLIKWQMLDNLNFRFEGTDMRTGNNFEKEQIKEEGLRTAYSIAMSGVQYLIVSQLKDQYPVEVRASGESKRSLLKDKKPWIRHDHPKILFLNTLPREKSESQGGIHASPRGHERRGHWRKITHERYKNHPKFGDRIRVKAAWIGPKVADYKGNTYTLLKGEPEECPE